MAQDNGNLRAQIDALFRTARKQRDEATKNVIGMLKNKVLVELKSGKDVEENDELWLKVIKSYAKQMGKAVAEYEKAGERGKELLAEAKFEQEFCEQFLPKKLDEAATEELVKGVIEAQGINSPKMIGKLMGAVMKTHRDTVDAKLVRQIAQRLLTS